MISHVSHVMTLANSIIGVSVLAMPYCFKQCGIILAIVVLLLCSLLSRMACHFLIKSAVMSRRRNFEYLAFHAFGPMGKFLVELFIIGFLLGSCIAFFVVVGDLGPQIIGKILGKNPEDIRLSFLLTTGAFIVLPLGLLKNIDSLATVCTAAIGFYLCLVLKVVGESMDPIFRGDWYENVNYWRSAGILQCLPIFSMALFCQTQLFEIYESIQNVSLEKMNVVVRGALNICTLVYLCVGFFGYVAFCNQPFSGNILTSFEPSLTSDIIKIGFVLSVIFSFPLVIFPCRASLNSLLFHQVHTHDFMSKHIPEIRFRCLTLAIVTVAMITGMLMQNIEFVLGLVGSTIGVMICVIFPAAFFISISTKNTNERLLAQGLLFIGVWIMILGTYANLYAMEESSTVQLPIPNEKTLLQMNNIQLNLGNNNIRLGMPQIPEIHTKDKDILESDLGKILENKPEVVEIRHEPPVPVERPVPNEKGQEEIEKIPNPMSPGFHPGIERIVNSMGAPDEQPANKNIIDIDNDKKNEQFVSADKTRPETVVGSLTDLKLEERLRKNEIETEWLMKEKEKILEDLRKQEKEIENDKKEKNLILVKDTEPAAAKDENPAPIDEVKLYEKLHIIKNSDSVKPQNKEIIVDTDSNKVPDSEIAEVAKVNMTKMVAVPNESRGPILNALTNRTATNNLLNPPTIENVESLVNQIDVDGKPSNVIDKIPDKNLSMNIPLPLALKLNNDTKRDASPQDKVNKKDFDEQSVIQRDILEVHNREKRNIDVVGIEGSDVTDLQDNFKPSVQVEISSSTDTIIKTNSYLAEQQFENKIAPVLKTVMTNQEYRIVKNRDLKALKPGKSRD